MDRSYHAQMQAQAQAQAAQAQAKAQAQAQAHSNFLANFYGSVVQDVVHNLRGEFEMEGVDESVLDELQTLWETKLKEANVLPPDYRRPICSPRLNLNANPEYDGAGWTPSVENLFTDTPTPAQGHMTPAPTPLPTPLPNATIFSIAPDRHGNFGYQSSRQQLDNVGQPLDFMAPPSMSRESTLLDINKEYVENGEEMYGQSGHEPPETKDYMDLASGNKRKRDYFSSFPPQTDGAGDGFWPSHLKVRDEDGQRQCADEAIARMVHSKASMIISQMDGLDDNYDVHVTEEDYNFPGEEEAGDAVEANEKLVKENGDDSEDSEPPLNEDDDDDGDDFNEGEEISKTDNLVVAQFEKVTKVKGKWKCILKDGIMQLNKKDYLFSKANGEFDFF